MIDATRERVEPQLVRLIASVKVPDVELAVCLLLDYIDAKAAPVSVIGESEAFAMFRDFVRENAPALRMVASWGDGECGALHEVLREELQGWMPGQSRVANALAGGECPDSKTTPLFAEEGGVDS